MTIGFDRGINNGSGAHITFDVHEGTYFFEEIIEGSTGSVEV